MGLDEQKWLERLLWRLEQRKEKRWVEWREDIKQHLITALRTPEMSCKPNNMQAGLWYWVSEMEVGETKGFCLLVMFKDLRKGRAALHAARVMQMADTLGNAGYRYSFDQHVPVSEDVRPLLHHNTRRLSRRVDGRSAVRFSVLRVRFWKPMDVG